jgi:hypothetical protein
LGVRGARRLLLSFLAVSALHLAAAVWMLVVMRSGVLAQYFGACAALTAAMGVLGFRLLRQPPRGKSGGDGGGPVGNPSGPEPHWWPEFEREFWRHVGSGPRERAPL